MKSLNRRERILFLVSLLLLGAAVYFLMVFFNGRPTNSDEVFFYDTSEKQLFKGSRQSIPPIKGINDAQEDAVRAVVVSTNGNPADKSSWKIAYLEKYSPALKRQMEEARKNGASPSMGREVAQANRFVRRLEDEAWYSLATPEGEQIVNAWITWGPDGGPAVICSP